MAMTFSRTLLGPELVLIGVIVLALGVIYAYLRWRGQLNLLRRVWPPALLWAIFGPLDALVTIVGTWGAPWREANSLLRAWLIWDAWVGQVLYTFLYVLFWAAVVIGLEELRRRVGGVWAAFFGAAQLLILYALAVGHLFGFLSWTPYLQPIMPLIAALETRAPWLFADWTVGLFYNYALILGGVFTAVQLAIAFLLRARGRQAPIPGQARAIAARRGRTTGR